MTAGLKLNTGHQSIKSIHSNNQLVNDCWAQAAHGQSIHTKNKLVYNCWAQAAQGQSINRINP
jgi:hypothetical protein